jgi:hypothetical protein
VLMRLPVRHRHRTLLERIQCAGRVFWSHDLGGGPGTIERLRPVKTRRLSRCDESSLCLVLEGDTCSRQGVVSGRLALTPHTHSLM